MSELSEKEIIKNLEEFLKGPCEICKYCDGAIRNHRKAIQGLLDLYNKEKDKNKKAIEMLQEHIKHCEQETEVSLSNEICNIALKFDKHLLQELLEERN